MRRLQQLSPAAFAVAASLLFGACTAYQPLGATGGFRETQLSDNAYQVRVQGNGYTSRDRTSQYLLRRCAELTLEHGKRYFTLAGGESQNSVGAGGGMTFSFPSGQVILTIVDLKEGAFDAAIVVAQTDDVANGRLSPAAQKTLADLGIKREPRKAKSQ